MVKDIINTPPKWIIRNGTLLFSVIFLCLIGLTFFIKYPDKIFSEIVISTKTKPQSIYAIQNGVIDSIFCLNNSLTKKNKHILLLKNSANYKDILKLIKWIDKVKITEDTIQFSQTLSPSLTLGEVQSSFSSLSKALFELSNNNKYGENSIKVNYANKVLTENINTSRALKRQLDIYNQQIKLSKTNLDRSKSLFKKGVISKLELEKHEIEHLNLLNSKEIIVTNLLETKSLINNSTESYNIKKINESKNNQYLINNIIKLYYDLKISLSEWEKKYLIKSGMDGKVSYFMNLSKGDFIEQGIEIATLVPQNNIERIGIMKTDVKNSGKILINQKVNIMLEDYNYLEYGMLIGKVISISSIPNKEGKYYLEVELENYPITTHGIELPNRYQMNGFAEIITKELSLNERILFNFRELISSRPNK